MNTLESLLLVLILFSGEDSKASASALAEHLADIGQNRIQVVFGDDANAILAGKGLGAEDLTASAQLGQQLTRNKALAIIQLRIEDAGGGDQLLEGRIWSGGRIESHTTIVGADINPVPLFARGVWGLLARSLPQQDSDRTSHDDPRTPLVELVRDQAWTQVLGRLAGTEERSAREWYYMVLAYARLGQRESALTTLRHMQEAYEDHILTTAARELIPPIQAEQDAPAAENDDGDTLRDEAAAPVAEDGDDERALRDPSLDDDDDDVLSD